MDFIESPPKIKITDLRSKLFELLQDENYAYNSILLYRKIYDLLELYSSDNNIEFYTPVVGENFLNQCTKYRGKIIDGRRIMTDSAVSVITTLNNVFKYNELKNPHKTKEYYCPDCFISVLKDYLNYLETRNYHPNTVDQHYRYVATFLTLVSEKTTSLTNTDVSDLYEIFEILRQRCSMSLYIISSFLRFIYKLKFVDKDFSKLITFSKECPKIPTVHSKADIISTLQVINFNTVKGKRDYAIILLAYRLGLRSSDIFALKFDNVDFDNNRINLTQIKTGIPLSLPLLDEVKQAILQYLIVRPKSNHTEIFLRTRAPFAPLTRIVGTTALRRYFAKANVDTTNKKRGLHSLRSTLASELISEKVSLAVTQKILGHTNSTSINNYVKLDIESLRDCSLPVPKPSGQFKKLLEIKEV